MNFGVAYLFLVITFFLLIPFVGKQSYHVFMVLNKIACSSLAFLSIPEVGKNSDALRFDLILNMSRLQISQSENLGAGFHWIYTQSQYAGNVILDAYLWFFSFFEENGVLRFVTIFLFLTVVQVLVGKFLPKKEFLRARYSVFIFFELIFNIYFEIEGIRNFLAFVIMTWLILDYFVSRKWTVGRFIVYVIGIIFCLLFHSSTIFLIIIFILSLIPGRYTHFVIGFLLLGFNFGIPAVLTYLSTHTGGFVSIQAASALQYFSFNSDFSQFSGRQEQIGTTVMFIILMFCIFLLLRRVSFGSSYKRYVFYLVCFTLGMYGNTQVYLRVIQAFLFSSLPLLSLMLSHPMYSLLPDLRSIRIDRNSVIFISIVLLTLGGFMFIIWYRIIYYYIFV